MNTFAPYLLFALVVLSAVGPARADEPRPDTTQARAVASMELPRLARKLRARVASAEAAAAAGLSPTTGAAGNEADAPASVAVMMPNRP